MAVATSTIIASVALATTAASGYMQYQAAGEAADAQREGQAISGAQQQIQQRRSQRQSVREERIRRAQIMQASESTGVAGSSSEAGALGALGTMSATNRANVQGGTLAAQGITRASQRAADAQQSSNMWGTIGGVGGSIFTAAGGFGNMQDGIFGGGPGQPVKGGFQSEVFTVQ